MKLTGEIIMFVNKKENYAGSKKYLETHLKDTNSKIVKITKEDGNYIEVELKEKESRDDQKTS